MNKTITDRLTVLRQQMAKNCFDFYLIPTSDFHESEYVGDHFKAREYITGFTGSAGTALVTENEAFLWTDGRYFLQASSELEGTGVTLMRMGEEGVPALGAYLSSHLKHGDTLGYDGRVVSYENGRAFENIARRSGASIRTDMDLVGEIWTDRPSLPHENVFVLDNCYAGRSCASKIDAIREVMAKDGADHHLMATLDDICWTLNIRGNDIEYMPLVLSYLIITKDQVILYIDDTRLSEDVLSYLKDNQVTLRPYDAVYEDLKNTQEGSVYLLDPLRINVRLRECIPAGVTVRTTVNPAYLMKTVKNETEIANMRKAGIMDSVCHIRLMKWLKENAGSRTVTEIDVSDRLDAYRAEWPTFVHPSFAPICGAGPHGAIVHYEATSETNAPLETGTLFLMDTGANFYEGTTDITRTYALGEVPEIMKKHFTAVCTGNLRLADTVFKMGCSGAVLDMKAREPLWKLGLDFNHGTGHGLGYLMNVHEGPGRIGYQAFGKPTDTLKSGMVITDEPGVYIEGSHGIRLENDLLIREKEKTSCGQFLCFEILTFVPFDLDAIVPEDMCAEDKELLNRYHEAVYEKNAPWLNDEEKAFLRKYTRAI